MNLVDTDVLVQYLRQDPKADTWFMSLSQLPAVPGFVSMELKWGCRNLQELASVNRLLRPLTVIWPSPSACEQADRIYGAAKLSHGIGILDALIAATAIENRATLYTFNLKHFAVVP